MFIDTHCHLGMIVTSQGNTEITKEYILSIENVLKDAQNAGVGKIINIGTNLIESTNACEVAKKFENVFATVATHPCDCKENWIEEFKEIEKLVERKIENKIVAIGETGLDFYHKPFYVDRQNAAFRAHIELALKYNLPLVVHVREASDELLKILEEYTKDNLRGVIHCFSHSEDFAKVVLNWGFNISIGAYVTYPKNEPLRELIKKAIPLKNMFLESDAPFLPPQQYRGKTNKPEYLPLFSQVIAELKNVNLKTVEEITTANAECFFKI